MVIVRRVFLTCLTCLNVCMAIKYIIVCLWKHHVNLLLQSFRSVSPDQSNDASQQITTLLYTKRACELNKSHIISTDEDPGLRIESFAVIHLRGVSRNKSIKSFFIVKARREMCWFLFVFAAEINHVISLHLSANMVKS